MEVTIRHTSGAQFVGETGSGHAIVIDGPEDIGGRNTCLLYTSPSPRDS